MKERLLKRSGGNCELCNTSNDLSIYYVGPGEGEENAVLICSSLIPQIEGDEDMNPSDWTFLPEAMWSEIPAIQVLSWRMLQRFKNESWASDALDILYLDEETQRWAEDWDDPLENKTEEEVHKDAFGNVLADGDSVVLTKTLDVKGSSISAKLGTVVRNIRLVPDHPDQIEGRVEGQQIVILTKFLRKQS